MRSLMIVLLALLAAAPAVAREAMVAAANPLAVQAGLKVLEAGGGAADAAVAVQATLGLVEPQSSGVGGGAFMLYYDARTHRVSAYDGREYAPAGDTPTMFLGDDGKPLAFSAAGRSGRSAGVPGAIDMLWLAQRRHGRLAWKSLFGGSERLAEDGFIVSPRLANYIVSDFPQAHTPDISAYFTRPDGQKYRAGDRLKNPAYAATLRLIAAEGPKAILSGRIARDIVAKLQEGPLPGAMTLADLAAYRPRESAPLCRPYRVWTLCEPPAPSGGVVTLEMMGLLAHTDIAAHGPADAEGWYLLSQAERLAYADDLQYVGDPAFVSVPVDGLLDPAYLAARARLIGAQAGPAPAPGEPAGAPDLARDATHETAGTSSFAVIDRWGDVAVVTTTVNSVFGDGRMVDGFILNNELTDFSFSPTDAAGAPAANAVGPRKRPRSSMAPSLVLDRRGRFVAAVGSPGGLAIPAYVVKALVGVLDWKLSMQNAIDLPNLLAIRDYYATEPAKFAPGVIAALAAKGVTFSGKRGGEDSGLHGLTLLDGVLAGGADPRREGTVGVCCGAPAAVRIRTSGR